MPNETAAPRGARRSTVSAEPLSEQLRRQQAATETDVQTAKSVVAELQDRWGSIQLDGTPAEVAAHEGDMREARLTVERLTARLNALTDRIAAAELREKSDHITELVKRGHAYQDERDTIMTSLKTLLPDVAAKIRRLDEMRNEFDQIARHVDEAGRRDELSVDGRTPIHYLPSGGFYDLLDMRVPDLAGGKFLWSGR